MMIDDIAEVDNSSLYNVAMQHWVELLSKSHSIIKEHLLTV